MKDKIIQLLLILVILLVTYFSIAPFFAQGFFPMHDDTQPARVYEMAKALSYNQFPVRWVSDLGYGYGYPIFNFYAPLPYYLGALSYLLVGDILIATKSMFIIGILLSGLTMYFLMKEVVGNAGGMVSAVLYIYAPYHAVNIYVRGAVGELYAYGFMPLIILGIWIIFQGSRHSRDDNNIRKGLLIGSLGFSGVLLSHNVLGLISLFILGVFIFLTLLYTLFFSKKAISVITLLLLFFIGIGMSSFFILPAFIEKKYTRIDQLTTGGSDYRSHFVYFDQLWDSPWGYAGSAPGREDGMSYKIGKTHLIIGFTSIILTLISFRIRKKQKKYLLLFLIIAFLGALSIYLMTENSKFIWELIPLLAFIQYPWRFLNITILSLSISSTIFFALLPKRINIVIACALIIIIIGVNIKYFKPQMSQLLTSEDYIGAQNIRYKISKISDEYLPNNFQNPENVSGVAYLGISADQNLHILEKKDEPARKIYQIKIDNPAMVITNITNFPGWRVWIDKKEQTIIDNYGRIGISIPVGFHRLEFIFQDTPIRKISNMISLLSIFLLGYIILFDHKKNYDK